MDYRTHTSHGASGGKIGKASMAVSEQILILLLILRSHLAGVSDRLWKPEELVEQTSL